MKILLVALLLLCVAIWGAWLVFPSDSLPTIIQNIAGSRGLSIEVSGVRKGLFYTFDIEKVVLGNRGGEIASVETVRGRINPFRFALLQFALVYEGQIAGGNISGDAVVSFRNRSGTAVFNHVGLSGLPFLNRAGIRGSGDLDGKLEMTAAGGRLEFSGRNLSLEPLHTEGLIVPMGLFKKATGAFSLEGNSTKVESLSLEGESIYARVKGIIRDRAADLSLELMPERSLLEQPLIAAGLEKYKVSPGYYVIPIKRNPA